MPVKQSFSTPDFERYLRRCQEIAMDMVFNRMAFLAEECVNRIRSRSKEESWIDHSGNLRSSIGYIITVNGNPVVNGGFMPTNTPEGNGADGQKAGSEYADGIITQFSHSPIALVEVAGMEYALYVEARDNKDVLASTELWARSEWSKRMPKLKANIEKEWEKLARQMNMA